MVEMVVSETQKLVDRLAGLQEPPSSFLGARAGNRQWPPQSILYFKANKFSKAYFYRFLAALTYIGYQCPQKSIEEAWSAEKSINLPYLHEIMSRDTFKHVKAALHCQTDGEETGNEDSAGLPMLQKIGFLFEMFRERCRNVFIPGEFISFDEMMVLCVSPCPFFTGN